MTGTQKIIIEYLLEGATIAPYGDMFRLRDARGNPLLKVHGRTFQWLKGNLLRKQKGLFLINKSKMRQFHGNSFVKKAYKGKATAPRARIHPP